MDELFFTIYKNQNYQLYKVFLLPLKLYPNNNY